MDYRCDSGGVGTTCRAESSKRPTLPTKYPILNIMLIWVVAATHNLTMLTRANRHGLHKEIRFSASMRRENE